MWLQTKVLDIGCGMGDLSLALGARYTQASVLGVDLDAAHIRQARQSLVGRSCTPLYIPPSPIVSSQLGLSCAHLIRSRNRWRLCNGPGITGLAAQRALRVRHGGARAGEGEGRGRPQVRRGPSSHLPRPKRFLVLRTALRTLTRSTEKHCARVCKLRQRCAYLGTGIDAA